MNYLSIAGVLWHIGPEGGAPVPPINLLADFGGGGSLVVMGILAALVERATSGEGRWSTRQWSTADAQLMSIFFGLDAMGTWGPRGTNLLDGGAHFYNVYETSDGEYVSIASYEPKFYVNLLALIGPLGFDDVDPAGQMDRSQWPALRARIGRADPHAHERAVGRVLRGPRGVLRSGAFDVASTRASAQRRTQHVRRCRRRTPARTRAPLQPHTERGAGRARRRRHPHRYRLGRLGLRRRRHRGPQATGAIAYTPDP